MALGWVGCVISLPLRMGETRITAKAENRDKEPRTCSCSVLFGSVWYQTGIFIAGVRANKELCVLPSPADRLMLEHMLLFFFLKDKSCDMLGSRFIFK